MKVTDLMIGDYICLDGDVKYDYPIQVQQIGYQGNNEIVADNDVFDVDDIHPIPLTEEILVKSGFVKDGNGDYEINDGIVIVMDWKGKSEHFACAPYEVENCFGQYHYLYVELFECKYVHQLQHLLRLCGIEKSIIL